MSIIWSGVSRSISYRLILVRSHWKLKEWKLKEWIFKILDIRKVLALMIAGILWYYVYNLERSIEEYIVPIDFSEKPLEIKRMEIKRMDMKNGYSRYWT